MGAEVYLDVTFGARVPGAGGRSLIMAEAAGGVIVANAWHIAGLAGEAVVNCSYHPIHRPSGGRVGRKHEQATVAALLDISATAVQVASDRGAFWFIDVPEKSDARSGSCVSRAPWVILDSTGTPILQRLDGQSRFSQTPGAPCSDTAKHQPARSAQERGQNLGLHKNNPLLATFGPHNEGLNQERHI